MKRIVFAVLCVGCGGAVAVDGPIGVVGGTGGAFVMGGSAVGGMGGAATVDATHEGLSDGGVDRLPPLDLPPACVPQAEICNSRDDNCDGLIDEGAVCLCEGGRVVMTAEHGCVEEVGSLQLGTAEAGSCVDGRIPSPLYFRGLPCPATLAVTHEVGWAGPCDGCIDGVIITNPGTSTNAAWRNTESTLYCCDSNNLMIVER